ncbi:FAD-dependent oxidoreductase [Aspergillus foveolatus]|uniref:FAD-dependent oxidoreductase n=1 Tax=Aspergillus foveolatus TaxID=210207 RepID=UPI003CCDD1D5
MTPNRDNSQLRVIIIGGAVSGLTLAHCLEKARIDYVVLEKHRDITTNIGGSVALQPAGCRILDQLGVLDHLWKYMNDIQAVNVGLPDGYTRRHAMFARNLTEIGYPFSALTRRNLLYTLFNSLEGRSKVKVGARVVGINRSTAFNGQLTVTTENGEHYTGDIVVGADGVHGIALKEMWRLAEPPASPALVKDKSSMTVDYMCLFGMTTPSKEMTATMKPGEIYTRSYLHVFWTIIPNFDTTINWFVMIKLDRTYVHPDVPRWSQREVKAKLEELGGYPLYGQIRFRDLCANLCIETSAALANSLHRLTSRYAGTFTKPTDAEIRRALSSYQDTIHARIEGISAFSYRMSRVHSLEIPFIAQLMLRYTIRIAARLAHYKNTKEYEGGMVLEYLPLPERDRLFATKRAITLAEWRAFFQNLQFRCGVLLLVLMLATNVFLFPGSIDAVVGRVPLVFKAGLNRDSGV